jgi:hypothetical protein
METGVNQRMKRLFIEWRIRRLTRRMYCLRGMLRGFRMANCKESAAALDLALVSGELEVVEYKLGGLRKLLPENKTP